MTLAVSWIVPLVATIVIESAILVALGGSRRRQMLIDGPLIQLVTNPAATWLVRTGLLGFWPTEVLVVIVEALLLQRISGFDAPRAWILSLVCNAVTVVIAWPFWP